MQPKVYRLILFLLATIILTSTCKKMEDEPMPPSRERRVTTLTYTMIQPGTDTIVLSYRDLDGTGGNPPVIEGGILKANNVYFATLEVFDERESPIENITLEIEDNNTNFQAFFNPMRVDLMVNYADTDDDGYPIGLFTANITGAASTGTLVINLQQDPDKLAPGVEQGDPNNAAGFTEVQVSLPITIQ